MNLIAIDIGNSTVSLAVFSEMQLNTSESISVRDIENDQLAGAIKSFREICGPQPLGAETVPVVSVSVNSAALSVVEKTVYDCLKQNTLVLGRDFPLEMKIGIENPETIGRDRLLTAFAAYEVLGSAAVVADFGSATTIDCINDQGIFLGGTIAPGLSMSARALNQFTDALPEINPAVPKTVFGVNTHDAINNGIYYGAIGALREIVERYAEELGHWPQVIATGGYCKMVAARCDFIDSLVPHLSLNGLYLAYSRYRELLESGGLDL